jgi:hypothetical protein
LCEFEICKFKTRGDGRTHQDEPAAFVEKATLPTVFVHRHLNTLVIENILALKFLSPLYLAGRLAWAIFSSQRYVST